MLATDRMQEHANIDRLEYSPETAESKIFTKMVLLFLVTVFFILINVFIVWYVKTEQTIYILSYWGRYIPLSADLFLHPLDTLIALFHSLNSDYNNFAALPLALISPLLGSSRLGFIIGLTYLFAFPSIILFLFLFNNILNGDALHESLPSSLVYSRLSHGLSLTRVTSLLLAVSLPAFWIPILMGYGDIAGIVLINLILLIYLQSSPERRSFRSSLGIGILLAVLIFVRRWYSIWVGGFSVAVGVDCLIFLLKTRTLRNMVQLFSRSATIFVSFVVVMMLIAPQLFLRMLFNNYANEYSAFQLAEPTIFSFIAKSVEYYGVLSVVLFIIGLLLLFRSAATRRSAIFLVSLFVSSYIIFVKIQWFAPYHQYLLLSVIILAIACAIESMFNLFARHWIWFALLFTVLAIIFATMFCSTFVPSFMKVHSLETYWIAPPRYYPLVRNDIPELSRLEQTLFQLVGQSNEKISVLADSPTLNYFMLVEMHLSLQHSPLISKNILSGSELIDKRDGFPSHLLLASYVVIGSPIQTTPEGQQVVYLPAKMILDGEIIGQSFEKLPYDFLLQGGVHVYIFRRIRPFRQSDIDEISRELRFMYPENPKIYTPKIPQSLIEQGIVQAAN